MPSDNKSIFEDLFDFVAHRMRMSHIYQPVMLKALLRSGGIASEREIAKALVLHDESQIEYYTQVTNNMVGRVLLNHHIVERNKQARSYQLVGFETLNQGQIGELIELCQRKLDAFLEKRGDRIFEHRRKSAGYISGTLKYDVLKRARFRCELCGIPADEKALEVDHILPRNHGGSDDPSNLQALCYSCNAMKRDRDDMDFREIRSSYDDRDVSCAFCTMKQTRVIEENQLAYLIEDAFPVTRSHSLIIPKRHALTYFDLGQPEINACNYLIGTAKRRIEEADKSVSGFNIGVNNGESAGQTVLHAHIHLIPRRLGDVKNARGGVRSIIDGKGDYGVGVNE